MSNVDNALRFLDTLFYKWGWEDWQAECQKMRESTDTCQARRWLYVALVSFEEFEGMPSWTSHKSGVVLFNAGLIALNEVDQGASALLIDIGEQQLLFADAPP